MYEFVDRQPYYAEIVDQGLSKTSNGEVFFKLYIRVLGKVTNFSNPEKDYEPVPGFPEHEIRFNFYGPAEYIEWRVRDLKGLGFTGDDLTVLDPRHDEHQSLVGKKIIVSPNIKVEADDKKRIFWNVVNNKPKKRFVGDVDMSVAKNKLSSIMDVINSKSKATTEGGSSAFSDTASEVPF